MRNTLIILLVGWMLSVAAFAQEQPPADPNPEGTAVDTIEVPVEQPRVVGQGTQEELDALTAMEQSEDPAQQIALGAAFLEAHPQSGLTAYVHYVLSTAYRKQNDIENFLKHGEEALLELPDLPQILAYMAFFNSERRQPLKARKAAMRALELLETMDKPDYLSARDWAAQKMSLSAEAHYGLGRVNLADATRKAITGKEHPTLRLAVDHFVDSLKANPDHQFATFRLAEAYQRQKDFEASMQSYARAVAMQGQIGEIAKGRLVEIHNAVRKTEDGIDLMVAEQTEKIIADRAAQAAALDQIQAEADAAAAAEAAAASEEAATEPAGEPTEEQKPPSSL